MSSMYKLSNDLRSQALVAVGNIGYTDVGIITAYDPTNRLVFVEISPANEDTEALRTGWIPLTTPWGGNGWGMFAAPAPGVACLVHYQNGSKQSPYASLIAFGGTNRPLKVDSGEFWLVHKSGSFIKLTNDGKVSINSMMDVEVNALEQVKLGEISGDLKKLVKETIVEIFNTHTHGGGPQPDQQMSDSDLTEHVVAN